MDKITKVILTSVMVIAGFILLYLVDWKIGIGVFLILWSHNIERHTQNSKVGEDSMISSKTGKSEEIKKDVLKVEGEI